MTDPTTVLREALRTMDVESRPAVMEGRVRRLVGEALALLVEGPMPGLTGHADPNGPQMFAGAVSTMFETKLWDRQRTMMSMT